MAGSTWVYAPLKLKKFEVKTGSLSKAFSWMAFGAIFQVIVQFTQLAILVRLLTPQDYGIFAIVIVSYGLAMIISDMGLNSAYIKNQKITKSQRSTLFWLGMCLAGVSMLILNITAPIVAIFFSMNEASLAIKIISIALIISALGAQIKAQCEKEMQFPRVVKVEIVASIFSFSAAVFMALNDPGIYVLVYAYLVNVTISTILYWLFLRDGWLPILQFSIVDVKGFWQFGVHLSGHRLLNNVITNLDVMIAARLLSPVQLGLYSVPRNFLLKIQLVLNPVINRISFPYISKISQDKDKVAASYLAVMQIISVVNVPIYLGILFFAEDFTRLYFGDQWANEWHIVAILSAWGLFKSFMNPVGSLLMGMGKTDLSLKWAVWVLLFSFPILYFGSWYGKEGVSISMLFLSVFLLIAGWFYLIKPLCSLGFSSYFFEITKSIAIGLGAFSIGSLTVLGVQTVILSLSIGVTVSIVTYILFTKYFNFVVYQKIVALFKGELNEL
jgi:O-antigen/teichoic acid export membrane protein